jgi:hypothetical protein
VSPSTKDFYCEISGAQITILSVLEDDGVEELTRALGEVGRERIVVLYDPAAIAVARALPRKIPPSTSLASWKGRASIVLAAYRQNRHRMVFASAAGVRGEPQQFKTSLLQHFKLSGEIKAISVPLATPDWTAWHLVLASQALAADAKAVLLDRELEAAALPLTPVSYDTDEALTELQAAASLRDLLIRQLSNLRKEVSDHFLSAGTKTGHSSSEQKSDQLGQSAKAQPGHFIQSINVNPNKSAAIANPPTPTVGRIVMNQYLPIDESEYRHIDISVHDIQDNETNWEHLKFKFCSWKGHEYIEFRIGPNIPTMFRVWPGHEEDQFGPYLNYPDPFNNEVLNISEPRDRMLLRLIFNILEKVLDVALRETQMEEAERSAWLDKANLFVANQRIAMAAWDAGDNGSPIT